mmetsp:Transcript_25908/g.59744  ORF Transcript_25908/g.59744 Transcript_25908/m.59744 type:complete len:1499 (+) Transcript_25908:64-4560(+)
MPRKVKREEDANDDGEPPRGEKRQRGGARSREPLPEVGQGEGGSASTYDDAQGPAGGQDGEGGSAGENGSGLKATGLDRGTEDMIEACQVTINHWKGHEEMGEAGIDHLEKVTEQFITAMKDLRGRKTILVGHNSVGKSWIINVMLALTVSTQAKYLQQCRARTKGIPAANSRSRLIALCEHLDPKKAGGLGAAAVIEVAEPGYLKLGATQDLVEFRMQLRDYVRYQTKIDKKAFAPFVLPCMAGAGSTTPVLIRVRYGNTFALVIKYKTEAKMVRSAWQWVLQNRQSPVPGQPEPDLTSNKAKTFKAFFEAMVSEDTQKVPLKDLREEDIKIKPEILKSFAGKELVFCGFGQCMHNDSKFVRDKLKEVLTKGAPETQAFWKVGLPVMESCRIFVPCGIVEGEGQLTDSPGSGESNVFLQEALKEGLDSHDVVMIISERNMSASESTIRPLRQSQFVNNLIKNPSKYHLAYTWYRERTYQDDLENILDADPDATAELEAEIEQCEASVKTSMRTLLQEKCESPEMSMVFSEERERELNKSWSFCAAYPTLLAGITFADLGEDPEDYNGEAGTSFLSGVLRATRQLFVLPRALEKQDTDIALDALVAGCKHFSEVVQQQGAPPPVQGIYSLEETARKDLLKSMEGMQKLCGRTAKKSDALADLRETLGKALDARTIAFRRALDDTVKRFFEKDAGLAAQKQALQAWAWPQPPANLQLSSLQSWCKGADPSQRRCANGDNVDEFQLRPYLLGSFQSTPMDFTPLIASLTACCKEHASLGAESFKAATKKFILEFLVRGQGQMMARIEEEIELHWVGKMSYLLDKRVENFLNSGVLGARVNMDTLKTWCSQAEVKAVVNACRAMESEGLMAGDPREVLRTLRETVRETILPDIHQILSHSVDDRVMRLLDLLTKQFKNPQPRCDASGNPSMVHWTFDFPTALVRRIRARKRNNVPETSTVNDLEELNMMAADLEGLVTEYSERKDRPAGITAWMDALIESAKLRWKEGANFCKLEEMLSGLEWEKIQQKGTTFPYKPGSTPLQTRKLVIADIPKSETATPFELPAQDPMVKALARAKLKLGPTELGVDDVCSSLFYVLLQGPTRWYVEDPEQRKKNADNLRAWLALHISNSNREEAFLATYGRARDDYVEKLALTAGGAQLTGDEVSIMHAAVYQPGSALAIDVWVAGKDRPYRSFRSDRTSGHVVNIALMSHTSHGVAFRSVTSVRQQVERRSSPRFIPPPPIDPATVCPRPIKGAASDDGLLYLILDANVLAEVGASSRAWENTFERLWEEQRGCVRIFIHYMVRGELGNLKDKKSRAPHRSPEWEKNKKLNASAKHAINFFIEEFVYGGKTPKIHGPDSRDRGAEKKASCFVIMQDKTEYADSKKTWDVPAWSEFELGVGHEIARRNDTRNANNDKIIRAFADHCVYKYGRGKVVMVTDDKDFQQRCLDTSPPHNQKIPVMTCFRTSGRPKLDDMWHTRRGDLKQTILKALRDDPAQR